MLPGIMSRGTDRGRSDHEFNTVHASSGRAPPHPLRTCIASSPRTAGNSVAIAALAIGASTVVGIVAAVAIGVNLSRDRGALVESFYRPSPSRAGRAGPQSVHHRVLIAAVIFFVVGA